MNRMLRWGTVCGPHTVQPYTVCNSIQSQQFAAPRNRPSMPIPKHFTVSQCNWDIHAYAREHISPWWCGWRAGRAVWAARTLRAQRTEFLITTLRMHHHHNKIVYMHVYLARSCDWSRRGLQPALCLPLSNTAAGSNASWCYTAGMHPRIKRLNDTAAGDVVHA